MPNQEVLHYVVGCDIDNTLVPINDTEEAARLTGYDDLDALCFAMDALKDGNLCSFGTVTGRTELSHRTYEREIPSFAAAAQRMDFRITSVGTAIHYRDKQGVFQPDPTWPPVTRWDSDIIHSAMGRRSELQLQPAENQNTHKLSYEVTGVGDDRHDEYVQELQAELNASAVDANIVFSSGQYLDFIPTGIHKGSALRHATQKLLTTSLIEAPVRPIVVAAGDSMNDAELLAAADFAIMPRNAHDSLQQWANANLPAKQRYLADQDFAGGVLEGLIHVLTVTRNRE